MTTYICYTDCANGTRAFSHLSGLVVSYDPRCIASLIEEQRGRLQVARDAQELLKSEQNPALQSIEQHNDQLIATAGARLRRLMAAEAVLGGLLVRGIVYTEDLREAIAYTAGTAAKPGDAT